MNAVEFHGVWEKYRIKFIRDGGVSWEEIWALQDVSFKLAKGEVLGVIGPNGAGKTTLLKLIAGMLIADKGAVHVDGKVAALMELGVGFNLEFTGRENIGLNARVYGLEKEQLDERMEEIIAFAGLSKFIDAPIKYYSQGMYMRLVFALAIFVEPDILLIDDILAVGDEEARQKCIKKIFELKGAGKTIVLVSHDLNMLDKLCARVILLKKGRIIKEGLPQRVIPFYLEEIGDKEGFAILESDKWRVVFNNGRVSQSFDDNFFTKGPGGYLSSFIPSLNIWVFSFNLLWKIKAATSKEIVAEGFSSDGLLVQIWTLSLKENQMKWQIEIKEDASRDPHVDFFLMPQYQKWVTLEKQGIFPYFMHRFNHQDLGESHFPEGWVGLSFDEEPQGLPHLIFKVDVANSQIKLFNSGYEQEARIVQLFTRVNNFISLDIMMFAERDRFKKYIKEERDQFRLQQEAEEERIRLEHTLRANDLHLFVDSENKDIKLFFKDREITRGNGLYSSLYAHQRLFTAKEEAQWSVEKISEKELILILKYENLSFTEFLNFRCDEENSISIKIEVESGKPFSATRREVNLELWDQYESWFTVGEKGDFLSVRYIDKICPIRLKDSKVSRLLLKPRATGSFPFLFFEVVSQADQWVLGLSKHRDKNEEFIGLNFSFNVPKREALMGPGRHVCFIGKIVLDKDIAPRQESPSGNILELKKGELRFLFERGKGRIVQKQKELTAGLGVYTSVRSQGMWYDSYQALWRVQEQDHDQLIIMAGDWPYLPFSQTWRIELLGHNLISWDVDMEIHEEMNLEIMQANLMLTREYKNWFIHGFNQGVFLDEYVRDYDILPFRFWYGVAQTIEAKAEILPNIVFKSKVEDGAFRSIVENTDYLYQSRLLQYQRTNNQNLLPGKYPYFKGVIEIGPKE